LQEVYYRAITMKEAIQKSMHILKQVMEEKLNETNVEVATVTKDGFRILSGEELQEYIRELA
jgi:20S proteasome subunit alpha 5